MEDTSIQLIQDIKISLEIVCNFYCNLAICNLEGEPSRGVTLENKQTLNRGG